jgi:putative toxin-antitoxin system antitoxin component (TIGR02293 family)
MRGKIARKSDSGLPARKPTECLIGCNTISLDQLSIFLLANEGFKLENVQEMLASSDLYTSTKVIRRIVVGPTRRCRGNGADGTPLRLTALQSAIAFQFARGLERATTILGSQQSAEEWLNRTCRHLGGNVPLELLANPLGFDAVMQYLDRIEFGIYQ